MNRQLIWRYRDRYAPCRTAAAAATAATATGAAAAVGIESAANRACQWRLTLSLLTRVGATTYVSGPAAKSYLDEKQFHTNGINLEYMKYDIRPYKQLYGEFNPNVSILDYIACV